MAKDYGDMIGRLTCAETIELVLQAFEALPQDDQLATVISMMQEEPDALRDEVLLTFEKEAKALY